MDALELKQGLMLQEMDVATKKIALFGLDVIFTSTRSNRWRQRFFTHFINYRFLAATYENFALSN